MGENTIMTVLVGSRAHGLATQESDWDYRGVYALRTRDILSLGYRYKGTRWDEGEEQDHTAYEVGHFLHLALFSNPTVLEMFHAPTLVHTGGEPIRTEEGRELRALFPHVWSSDLVRDAYLGYARNQQKKLLDDRLPEERQRKFGVAWLRVLWQGIRLLRDGVIPVEMFGEPIYRNLLEVRNGEWSRGQIVDEAEALSTVLLATHEGAPKKEADRERVNEYLMGVRAACW